MITFSNCLCLPSLRSILLAVVLFVFLFNRSDGQNINPIRYDIGNPTVRDIWVDVVNGDDNNPGTANRPLQTVYAAWDMIPQGEELTGNGWRINLMPGTYTADELPIYWEERYGTQRFPIIIRPAQGKSTVRIESGMNIAYCNYMYLIDLVLFDTAFATADIVHLQFGDHLLLHNCTLTANPDFTQECLKVNQCQNVYVEDCDISGAWDNAVDFVAVQYGHIVGNKIHNCGDWALYVKGGSAYFRVENNEFYNAGTGGFTAGQGTGFQFMTPPFLHYEAYDIKFFNNIVHHVEGAGFGVNGGYNILIAHNTCYNVGERSHVIEVTFGGRSCDGQPGGDFDSCDVFRQRGGWGNALVSDGNNYVRIPNKNVYIFNNIIYNAGTYQSLWQHLSVPGKYAGEWNVNVNAPNPAYADENLRIRGNVIWNGPAEHPLGVGDTDNGCPPDNPTCNGSQLFADNAFNEIRPEFANAEQLDFTPLKNGNIYQLKTFPIPDFSGNDRPAKPVTPPGNSLNAVPRDAKGSVRTGNAIAGAIIGEGNISSSVEDYYSEQLYTVHYVENIPYLRINVPTVHTCTISIFRITGEQISVQFPTDFPAGETWLTLGNTLSSGLYCISIRSAERTVLIPVVL